MENTKFTELDVEGVNYTVKAIKKKKKKKQLSPEKEIIQRLTANQQEQEREAIALKLLYNERFKIEDGINKKYSIEFFIRGGQDASLQFSFPPEYPSAVPPTITLTAPWVREHKRKELFQNLSNIFTENFGQCIMYKWIDKITEVLKKEVEDMKKNPEKFEEPQPVPKPPQEKPQEEEVPEIYEGQPIWDRGSCFSPYLAKVTSEAEVRKVISKIEDCRKVSTAWRNTFAYRISTGKGKITEVGEDGGEPKAGGNLLKRLITYNAENVIVFISRRFGGSMLGPDRYKHLNDAADNVLLKCGYKSVPHSQGKKTEKNKESAEQKKKDKKFGKKK